MTKEETNIYLINVGQTPAETEQERKLYSIARQYFNKSNALQKENDIIKSQNKILDILKPHLKMVQDPNGLIGLDYDKSALNMKEQQLINDWLGN